jgi:hypothetical protein
MPPAPAAAITDLVLGLVLGPIAQDAGNRFTVDGLTAGPTQGDALPFEIRRFEAASLRVASGPLTLEIGRAVLNKVVGQIRIDAGKPRLASLAAASAELSGVKGSGPLTPPDATTAGLLAAGTWCLGPLAAANGTIRAQIVDAHLLFDADVTVKVRQGQVDFNDATIEHVGPDSRMGVSRLGVYVDAPNGRSYLYQFSSALVSGVEYEKRGAMLGPWVTNRGKLQLQAFGEGLLRQGPIGKGVGFTDQARLLLDRTAMSGDVQLGDGKFAAPGVQAELVGSADRRNGVRVHSEAVGRGLTIEMPALSVRHAVASLGDTQLECDEVTGALTLRLFVEGGQLRFASTLDDVTVSGLRLHPHRP